MSRRIGQYVIERELGQGLGQVGINTVYLGRDPRLDREVVIKVLRPKLYMDDPDFLARFEQEAKTVASLTHNCIVPIYEYGDDGEWRYFVMPYMAGGTLRDRLEKGPLSLAEALPILRRVTAALDKAHSSGIVHLNLKPSNILFDEEGEAYLSDFGIMKLADLTGKGTVRMTSTGIGLGTPHYMSPEQLDGAGDLDGRADIYALGIILYEMLTGKKPYDHESIPGIITMYDISPFPNILEANPDLSPGIGDVIKTAMAKQTGERYESGTALMVAIQEAITQTEMIDSDASKDEKALTAVSEGFNSANIDGRPLPFFSIPMGNDLVEIEPEAAPKGKEQLRNRLITGYVVLLVAVLIFFVFLLHDLSQKLTNDNGNGEVASSITVEGMLIEGERPLADLEPAERANFYDTYPEMVIDQSKSYEAVIRTEKGDMVIQLFDNESPLAVNSFVYLATQGFYDGTVFHRVLAAFMAQGGDPTGSGFGGPGYIFDDEVENELIFDRPHLLAMANAGANMNGSQFFITFVETPHLNGAYTIFGELIDGEDVLNSITFIDPTNPADQRRVGDEILRIDIYES